MVHNSLIFLTNINTYKFSKTTEAGCLTKFFISDDSEKKSKKLFHCKYPCSIIIIPKEYDIHAV